MLFKAMELAFGAQTLACLIVGILLGALVPDSFAATRLHRTIEGGIAAAIFGTIFAIAAQRVGGAFDPLPVAAAGLMVLFYFALTALISRLQRNHLARARPPDGGESS